VYRAPGCPTLTSVLSYWSGFLPEPANQGGFLPEPQNSDGFYQLPPNRYTNLMAFTEPRPDAISLVSTQLFNIRNRHGITSALIPNSWRLKTVGEADEIAHARRVGLRHF
jgi:hypothetical protein